MRSDEVLWLRYLDGDESGLVELMEQYGNSVTLYINAYLHDVNDAEDLMIEAFAAESSRPTAVWS
ncbi:MAG: RNA polymerase sigma factor [Anaerovoracaceae bacterium]